MAEAYSRPSASGQAGSQRARPAAGDVFAVAAECVCRAEADRAGAGQVDQCERAGRVPGVRDRVGGVGATDLAAVLEAFGEGGEQRARGIQHTLFRMA